MTRRLQLALLQLLLFSAATRTASVPDDEREEALAA